MDGKERKMTDRLSYLNTSGKKEEGSKKQQHPSLSLSLLFFTFERISKYKNQNKSQMSNLIQTRKTQFQNGKNHNEPSGAEVRDGKIHQSD